MTSFNEGIEAAAQELQRAAEILEQSCGGMWSKAAQQRALLKRDVLQEMSNRVRALKRTEGEEVAHGPYAKTLRDLFATKAMQGMVAFSGSAGLGFGPGDIAGRAYQIADAMLSEREKQ